MASTRSKLNVPSRASFLTDRKIVKLKSSREHKCPVYVHKSCTSNKPKSEPNTHPPLNCENLESTESDQSIRKARKGRNKCSNATNMNLNGSKCEKKNTTNKRCYLDKIEESYWSQWKPNKDGILMEGAKVLGNKPSENNNKKNTNGDGDSIKESNPGIMEPDGTKTKNNITPVEIKRTTKLWKIDELTDEDSEANSILSEPNTEEAEELKFLKHTDSFILNTKKQSVERPHYQQPRCIRLYKNTSPSSYIRGGSYPLKPCLKKESSFKGKSRRPLSGSPYSTILFKGPRNNNKLASA